MRSFIFVKHVQTTLKALVNEDTLLRTHCCPWCFLGCANWETFVFFASRTQNLCLKQMLRARANGETFVSATTCPQQCVLVCQGLYMQCSDARFLSNDGSGHLSKVNLNNFVSSLTRREKINHLKVCSCVRSWTSWTSGLIFPNLTLRSGNLAASGWKPWITLASFKYNSAFRIFIRKLWAPSLVISIGNVSHNAVEFLWTSNLYLPLCPD